MERYWLLSVLRRVAAMMGADSIAIAISASSGTVTVFHEGRPILELERPALPSTS